MSSVEINKIVRRINNLQVFIIENIKKVADSVLKLEKRLARLEQIEAERSTPPVYVITLPDGTEERVENLKAFCERFSNVSSAYNLLRRRALYEPEKDYKGYFIKLVK